MAFFAATPASAETDGTLDFEVYDDQVNPGDKIKLFATCYADEFPPTPVVSDVLDAPDLTGERTSTGAWYVTSEATVKADAPIGSSPVSYQCGDMAITRNLEIHEVEERREIGLVEDTVRPGQKVTVRAFCTDESYQQGVPNSPVLVLPMLARSEGATREDPMTAIGSVDPKATPGTYSISFLCGEWVSGEFTVVAEDAPAPPQAQPQVPVKPKGAADTGSLDPAPASESNAGALALTLGGLAVFAGGGLLAHRRRQGA